MAVAKACDARLVANTKCAVTDVGLFNLAKKLPRQPPAQARAARLVDGAVVVFLLLAK